MSRKEVLSQILASGVVAVIRMKDPKRLSKVVDAIRAGGVKCIEITMTVPGAVDVIARDGAQCADGRVDRSGNGYRQIWCARRY